MSYNCDDFVHDIKDCLKLAENELHDRKNGKQGESTIDQLENYIMPDLANLLEKIINKESLPPNTQQDRYLASFGYAFRVWDWDMAVPSELYLKLLKIHENYRKI